MCVGKPLSADYRELPSHVLDKIQEILSSILIARLLKKKGADHIKCSK